MRWRRWWGPCLLLVLVVASLSIPGTRAQSDNQPGVRGTLYESPSFGWILLVQQPDWTIVEAASQGGIDAVHLHSEVGDGADQFFISRLDDGRGSEGCIDDIVGGLASMFKGQALQGWNQPDIEFGPNGSDGQMATVRVISKDDPDQDVLAYADCTGNQDGLLIGSLLLRTARDLDGDFSLATEGPLWPGDGHTGRARGPQSPDGEENPGVVRFLARDYPLDGSGYAFPFSCLGQESFTRPAEPPPPDRGWYACDGRIVNVDVVPVTIDVTDIVIGCENLAPGDHPSGCPDEPVAPSYYDVLSGPSGAGGPVLTLAPGESAAVVLWYALPGGDPPLELYYAEPDRLVLVGPTFFSEGTGTRAPVIIGR
jgi:hypothetical protein